MISEQLTMSLYFMKNVTLPLTDGDMRYFSPYGNYIIFLYTKTAKCFRILLTNSSVLFQKKIIKLSVSVNCNKGIHFCNALSNFVNFVYLVFFLFFFLEKKRSKMTLQMMYNIPNYFVPWTLVILCS